MKEIKLPYVKYLVSPPFIKPEQFVYRPVIAVKLSLGKRIIRFEGLIDSGADECIFPGWIAETLGHNVHKGKQKIFSGIGGSVLSYLHKTTMQLEDMNLAMDVYYSHEWNDMPFGLLGQASFFSRFNISFHYQEKAVMLKYYT